MTDESWPPPCSVCGRHPNLEIHFEHHKPKHCLARLAYAVLDGVRTLWAWVCLPGDWGLTLIERAEGLVERLDGTPRSTMLTRYEGGDDWKEGRF
jgi:hypothetical protein